MSVEGLLNELERCGVELSVEGERLRFRAPKGALTDEHRALLSESRDEIVSVLRAKAAGQSDSFPLSHGQQAIWLLEHSTEASPVNNLGAAIRVKAPLDIDLIRRAAKRLIDRHPTLRTTYGVDAEGVLVQHVAGPGRLEAEVESYDVQGLDPAAVRARIEADRDRPFDLENGPMLRVLLYVCGPEDFIQLLVVHHIGADGLSILLLVHEIYECAADILGGRTALPAISYDYIEHVRAEQAVIEGPEGERHWRYWRDQLAPPRTMRQLPADRPRPPLPSFRGGSVRLQLDGAVSDGVRALARQAGTTTFVVLLASFQMFLARKTGSNDVTVGTSVSQRFDERMTRAVGDFVNALPIRVRTSWNSSFRDVLALVRATVLDAMDVQAYPVQLLVEHLRPERTSSASPLFTYFFTFQQFEMAKGLAALASGYGDPIDHNGLRVEPYWLPQQAGQFDLTLNLADFDQCFRGALNYATDLFDEVTAAKLAEEYVRFLGSIVADPTSGLWSADERRRVLEEFNDTRQDLDPTPFIAQFSRAAAERPDAVAVRFGDEAIDYRRLDRASDRLAHRLREKGARKGVLVGLLAQRSPDMIVALLAIQKTGAAYVPLDPDFPAARLQHIVSDSGLALLVSDQGAPSWLPGGEVELIHLAANSAQDAQGESHAPLADGPEPDDPAYVLYTSGSTGMPNGVLVSHAALANFLGSMLRRPGLSASDRLAAATTISFDIAALELYLPLLAGGTVELLTRETASDGFALADALAASDATVMQATPATWRLLIEADWRPQPGFRAFCGGEALPLDLAEALLERGVELWNLYGPTETTVWSATGQVTAGQGVDVGSPIANTRIYVLDEGREPVPAGVEGEVWIGGRGLAEGYWRRPELTAERFVADPNADAPEARMYRTGDLGRWTDDGRLVILGRVDQQIKLRGFRIEPAEIELVLTESPEIARAVVLARGIVPDQRLVAYLVLAPGGEANATELRRSLRGRLPDYMIPSLFVEIDSIPLTPNGKLDRRALPDPYSGAATGGAFRPFVEPAPGLEATLAQIWKAVLGVDRIGADDNFFELGGHSLLTLRVAAAVKRQTGLSLTPRNLFFHTLRQTAATLPDAQRFTPIRE